MPVCDAMPVKTEGGRKGGRRREGDEGREGGETSNARDTNVGVELRIHL